MSASAEEMQREILLVHKKAWNIVCDRLDVALSCATVANSVREITGLTYDDLIKKLEEDLEFARGQRDLIVERLNIPEEAAS